MMSELTIAVARLNYRILRIQLELIEQLGVRRIHATAPARLTYERILINWDRTASRVLHDESSARRARALHLKTAPARISVALERRRNDQRLEAQTEVETEFMRRRREALRHQRHAGA
ncbi:hypothetical protein [Rhodococcus sp. NPDC003348]